MSGRTKLRLISAPIDTPVTLDEAKSHLRVDYDDDDALIQELLQAATDYCESFLGRALIDQTWELALDSFVHWRHFRETRDGYLYYDDPLRWLHRHEHGIKLPKPPLIDILSVKYDDPTGAEQTLDPSKYEVDAIGEPGRIVPLEPWPAIHPGVNPVRIQFRCGYVDNTMSPASGNVPSSIKSAIKLMVGDLYASRETISPGYRVVQNPLTTEFLLQRHRFDLSIA